jgi:hypothetical protein
VLTSASFIKINSRKALDSPPLEKPTHGAALCLPKITPQEFVPCILAGPACNSFSGNEDNQQIKFACKVLSVYLLVLQTRSDDPSENECRNNIDIPLAGFVVGKSLSSILGQSLTGHRIRDNLEHVERKRSFSRIYRDIDVLFYLL